MNKVLGILLIAVSVYATGCIQTRSEYTINPDGSGKVVHDILLQGGGLGMLQSMMGGAEVSGDEAGSGGGLDMFGGGSDDPQEQLKMMAQGILDGSEGVEAWKDVLYEITPEGKMHFRGTAYFSNISDLKFDNGGVQDDSQIEFVADADGTVTLTLHTQDDTGQPAAPEPASAMQPDELDAQRQEVRMQYNAMKPMLQGAFTDLKTEVIFRMPGTVSKATIFQQVTADTVQLVTVGAQILAAVDRKMQDDVWLNEQIQKGGDFMAGGMGGSEIEFNEMVFGTKDLVQVAVIVEAPLFDYAAEVAAAQANYDQMIADLGLGQSLAAPVFESLDDLDMTASVEPIPGPGPAPGPVADPSGNVQVGAARLVRLSNYAEGILPLGQRNGYTLSLVGQLPGPAVGVSGGVVSKATTDTVQNLVPDNVWDRKIRSAQLANDKQTVVFDVELAVPNTDARGLQELSGTLSYLTATGSRAVGLGKMKFEAGSQGSDLGAVIESVGKNPFDDSPTVLTLRVNTKAEEIESIEVAGLNIVLVGKQTYGDSTLVRCAVSQGSLPDSGQVTVNVYEGLQENDFAFSLSGISLTGGPMR